MINTENRGEMGFNNGSLVFLFWILYGIIEYVKTGAWNSSWQYQVFYFLPGIFIWIALTFPLRLLFRKSASYHPFTRTSFIILLILSAALIKVVSGKLLAFYAFVDDPLTWSSHFQKNLRFFLTESTIVAAVLMTLFFVLELYDKYKNELLINSQLENEVTKAQLQALQMQLQPHFLFNVLHTISNLIRRNENEKANNILEELSKLLRTSFEATNYAFISLSSELDFIRRYLSLEEMRFSNRLKIEIHPDEEALKLQVPQMILQPVIENAIKHGISRHLGPARIEVTARPENDRLKLSVFNTGPRYDLSNNGVGLSNTEKRLRMIYSENRLSISNKPDGVLVEILLDKESST